VNRPNSPYLESENKMDPFELGDNQIALRFKNNIFSVLLDTQYYEGTKYGRYYNTFTSDGTSTIYVTQPDSEKALDNFVRNSGDDVKFLVGYTGVGKTTLVRNYFKVFDRDVYLHDQNLIIYHSFFSMTGVSSSNDNDDFIAQSIQRTLRNATYFLSGYDSYTAFLHSHDDLFYENLYKYIVKNYPGLIAQYPTSPAYTSKLTGKNDYKIILNYIEKRLPLEYILSELKYFISKKEENSSVLIKNFVFILDDIEAKDVKYHNHMISITWQVKTCLQAYITKNFDIKILIVLRNYSFRIQKQKEAFREININEHDIILKREVPRLSDVILKRTDVLRNNKEILNLIYNKDSFQTASDALIIILTKLYGSYDEILMNLTHNNIFYAMSLILRIITNKKFLGHYEVFDKNGAFVLSPDNYNLRNDSGEVFKNNDVFSSLAYGENTCYCTVEDYYLTNILNYRHTQPSCHRLIGLYVINYFYIYKNNNVATLYGREQYVEKGTEIVKNMTRIFSHSDDSFKNDLRSSLEDELAYFYENGILLQHIMDSQEEYTVNRSRKYNENYKLYLSLRGLQLYKMLSSNSLLFEAYRDDIDTDLVNNDVPTLSLSTEKSIEYCIKYIDQLFEIEKNYINAAIDLDEYSKFFGREFMVGVLIKGVAESFKIFLKYDSQERQNLTVMLNALITKVNRFSDRIRLNKNFEFNKIDLKI